MQIATIQTTTLITSTDLISSHFEYQIKFFYKFSRDLLDCQTLQKLVFSENVEVSPVYIYQRICLSHLFAACEWLILRFKKINPSNSAAQ